jgi:hypothetical protein
MTLLRSTHVLSILALALAATACTSASDDTATGNDEVVTAAPRKVSGFDLTGPKALASDKTIAELCAAVISEEHGACERVRGEVKRANGCKDLCSKPIAVRGKAAGYDLSGFAILDNDRVPVEFCAAVVSEVQEACERAKGEISGANGCAHLCSKPIAPRGKVAGYDLTGFKILSNDRAPVEFCTAVVSEVQESCSRVGGTTHRANGCADLCSLPL